MLQWPSNARPAEIRMMIANDPAEAARSRLDYRAKYGPALRETWRLEMAVAPMLEADTLALEYLIEQAGGRVTPFRVPMLANVHTLAATASVALAADTTRGADTIELDIATADVSAGTLISLGDITTNTFQLFEVLEDAEIGTGVAVKIAPRVRYEFEAGADIEIGAACEGKFRLASDDDGAPQYRRDGAGYLNITMIEAV